MLHVLTILSFFVAGLSIAVMLGVGYIKQRHAEMITPLIMQQEIALYAQAKAADLQGKLQDVLQPELDQLVVELELKLLRESGRVATATVGKKAGQVIVERTLHNVIQRHMHELGIRLTNEFSAALSQRIAREFLEKGAKAVVGKAAEDALETIARKSVPELAGRLSIRLLTQIAGPIAVVAITYDGATVWTQLRSLDGELQRIHDDIRSGIRKILSENSAGMDGVIRRVTTQLEEEARRAVIAEQERMARQNEAALQHGAADDGEPRLQPESYSTAATTN